MFPIHLHKQRYKFYHDSYNRAYYSKSLLYNPPRKNIKKTKEKRISVYSFLLYLIRNDKKEKDVCFYDETHWSMKSANAMSEQIYKIIQSKKTIIQ